MQMQEVCPQINNQIFEILEVEKSINSRDSFGGTSKIRVSEAVNEARDFLKGFFKNN